LVHVCCLACGALSINPSIYCATAPSGAWPFSEDASLHSSLSSACLLHPLVPRICDLSLRTTPPYLVLGFLWRLVISFIFTDCWWNLLFPSVACLCKPIETYCAIKTSRYN
jgi:hypothetical protein